MALSLARRGLGMHFAQPHGGGCAGKGKSIVGKGYHRKAGVPHAEIVALNEAGKEANGATLYVNLEPCSHMGKTPPCVNALIDAGIRERLLSPCLTLTPW